MTSYIARLKAFNSEKRLSNEMTKPTKGVSSVLSVPPVCGSKKHKDLSSALSGPQVCVFEKHRGPFVGFVGLSGEKILECDSESLNVSENLKPYTWGPDKTDKRFSIAWIARADALEAIGLPRSWAEPFAKLLRGPPPNGFDRPYWMRLLPGANHFAEDWAVRARALGWSAEEVLGLDDIAPAARYDRRGIAWLVDVGQRVVALDEGGADIMTKSGSRLRFYRRTRAERRGDVNAMGAN